MSNTKNEAPLESLDGSIAWARATDSYGNLALPQSIGFMSAQSASSVRALTKAAKLAGKQS